MKSLLAGVAFLSVCAFAPAKAADDTPEALIETAYAQVKKVFAPGGASTAKFDPLAKPNAPKFFTKRALDNLAAAQKKDEMALDFDPFIAGQDAELGPITIKRLSGDACAAKVEATVVNFGKPARILFDVVHTRAGWRIAEIRGPEYIFTQVGRKTPLPPEKGIC